MKTRSGLTCLTALALFASAFAVSGCGVVKSREDRVVNASSRSGSGDQPGTAGSQDPEEREIRQIKQFLDLYTDHGAMTQEGLGNFFEKYKAQIAPFLAGLHMSSQDLIDLIFQFDTKHDGHVTPQELADGLKSRFPILRWIPDNTTEITRDELHEQVVQEYPKASEVAVSGLTDTLMRFDQGWAEGNGNGKVGRVELSGAGLVIAVLAQTDLSKSFSIPMGTINPINDEQGGTIDVSPVVGKMIQQKVDQQLFSRYAALTSSLLSQDDQRLEWMQVALKFFLADKLVHHFTPIDGPQAGQLAEKDAAAAFAQWGIPSTPHGGVLRKQYDSTILGGDGNGSYNSIEAFNYVTDYEFAQKLRSFVRGDFSSASVRANPQLRYLLAYLCKLMPYAGERLIMLDPTPTAHYVPRNGYWDGLTQFDDVDFGGNGDGKLDDGEVAMSLVYAKLADTVFQLFDANHNMSLERSEGNRLFATLNIFDRRIIDAFYAGVGLSHRTVWDDIKVGILGDGGHKWLLPYDFYNRVTQLPLSEIDQSLGGTQ